MSGFLGASVPLALAGDLSSVFLTPQRDIGGIAPDLVVEERGEDTLTITRNPVEVGAAVADNAFKEPAEVTIHCMWSNASLAALLDGGGLLETWASDVYDQLLTLQASAQPVTVNTGKRSYSNMLLAGISVVTSSDTEYALDAVIRCQQILLVTTQSTTLPPQSNQAAPEQTASPTQQGFQQSTPATPQRTSALATITGGLGL